MTVDDESRSAPMIDIIAALLDIIEKRMQENAALRAENQRLRAALKPLANIAVAIDDHGQFDDETHRRRPDFATVWRQDTLREGPFDLTMAHARAARHALESDNAQS